MKIAFACALLGVATQAGSGSYIYNTNGADWKDIVYTKEENKVNVCGTGVEQSPINLVDADAESDADMKLTGYEYFNWVVPKGWTADTASTIPLPAGEKKSAIELEITFPKGAVAVFEPAQFHVHAPSEH